MKGETTMKKLAMKMLSLLLVLSLLLPTCVFAQPGQEEDGTPGTQSTTSEKTTTFTEGGNSDEDADAPTGGGNGDENADTSTGGGNGDGDTKDVNGGSVTQSTNSEKTTTFTEGEDGDTPTEEPIVATVSIAVAAEDDGISQEELLEGYLYSISGLYGEGAAVFRAPSAPLPEVAQDVYNALAPEIEKVANGARNSAKFVISNTWTKPKADWGITGSVISGGAVTAEASAAIREKINMDALLHRLLSTMPYKLYWFDKTDGGLAMEYSIGFDSSSDNVTVQDMVVYMTVAGDYTDGTTSTGGTTPPKTYKTGVDTGKTGATTAAVNNAKNIVSANSTKRDYEKLKEYLSEICNRVEYNHAAAAGSSWSGGYGDPWQLIYVFDNDTTNKVVCEGYAKAFKYLCDLSTFNDTGLSCYLVTGTMSGGTGAGGTGAGNHMWNVVHIGGKNYLVDVTNCDAGTIGATDKLFLCGVEGQTAGESYHVTIGSDVISFSYDAATKGDYTKDELTLSGVKYEEPAMPALGGTVTITGASSPNPKIGDTLTANTGSLNYNGATAGTLSYQWKADGVEVGTGSTYTVQVGDYNKTITVTVTNSNNTGSVSSTATAAVVKKDGPSAPAAPVVKDATAVGFTYTAIAGQQYAISTNSVSPADSEWGDVVTTGGDKVVTGKNAKTDYYIYTRIAETSDTNASNASNYTKVTTRMSASKGEFTYTLTPAEYDGTAKAAPVSSAVHSGQFELRYDGESTVPTNVGTYALTAVVTAHDDYAATTVNLGTWEIKPKTIDVTWGSTTLTYTGLAQAPAISSTSGAVSSETVSVDVKENTKKTDASPAGSTYTAEAEILSVTGGQAKADNYVISSTTKTTTYTIKAATITVNPGAFTDYTGNYDGNPHSIAVDTSKITTVNHQPITIKYGTTVGTYDLDAAPTATNVSDSKTVYYKITAPNHEDKTGTATITINKVDYTPPAVSGTVRSNQVTTNKTLELPALPAGASYTASGTVGGTAGLISSHSVSGTTLTYSTTNQMDGISATITIPVTGATNYNNYYVVVTVIAKDKDDAGVSITNGSSASVTYGETITISATTTASENGTWTWNYDTTVFDVVGASSESTITLKAMKATTAAVPVKATFESTNYMGNASIAVNVNKATPVAENFEFTAPAVLVYNGSNKTATVTAKSGIAGMGAVTVKYFKDGSSTTDTKAAGTYVVKVDVAAGANYAAISDLTADGWTFTVTRANASVTTAPAAVGSLGYDGSAKNLITAGTCTGGTMNYRLGDSGAWGDAIPQATNAGTYTVWYKVVGDGNHNDTAAASVTVTIARQSIAPSVTVSGSYTYNNGNPIIPTVEVKNGGATLTAGTDYDVRVSDNTNAGTGKVTVKERADSNYTFTEVHKTFSIGRANQATLTVTGGTSVVYGETLTLGTSGGSGTGAVTYTVTDVTGKATITGNVLTPTQAGTVKVKATKAADTNYNAIDSAEVEITITQATPTGAPKFTKITSSGKTLGDAALVNTVSGPGDGFSVAGTVEWVDGSGTALADSTSVEANKSYGWKFTPTDSNYKSISGSVVVYTVRRVSHSGGAAADSAAAAAAQPTVYSGSRGESVKTLQERLNAKGFNAGSVDGIFGKNTQAAVMAFQKANGLAADGIVGKLTWAKLYDTTAALPSASTAAGTQPVVYRGSRGDAVRKLQELLNKKGFDCGAVDGIFGSKTYAAVVAFQKANGLSADGIVGPLTWGKLG